MAENAKTLVMDLKTGPATITLRPDLAPAHVERITTLAKQGFYDGIVFHRGEFRVSWRRPAIRRAPERAAQIFRI